jgi:putrescine:ornithine antiporter
MQGPPEVKRMNLVQLTFIVAVNMMGSGIIMLPTNMAQVGAISLLSWIVTALGSMAIAYGFAQAGLFNQRPGGMSAYAEDAYGKSGYFLVFFLYFLSLAIGNVAIAISAVGYLASFMPWLSSGPIATCIGVIGLLWLTTLANFGGPSVTGRIGSVTVWGVIIPVGVLSLIGWFWFKPDVFAAAWNPKGLSLLEGMGSSISLTLWAFLGMESAAQNSAAVENPKRDVPLACMFGTLGAAVIYILSTTVIQGIVPNPELAKSTGPFGTAYLPRLTAGMAVHDCRDRKGGCRRAHVPGLLLEGELNGRTHHRHGRIGHRAIRDGAVDDLAEPQRTVFCPGEPRRRDECHSVHHRIVGADRHDAVSRYKRISVPA